MFIDEIKVFARAGHGGRGCVAFHREAHRPKGGPSGGDGGCGGSVVLEATHDLNNLVAQFYAPRLIAENGRPGMGKKMAGRDGKELVVKVPCGTLVWRLDSPDAPMPAERAEPPSELREEQGARAMEIDLAKEAAPGEPEAHRSPARKSLVADLTEHGRRVVVCQGGRGGLGNMNFATARRQTPRFAQPGEPGEEGEFLLELRILADVGLVGYPNAGKSTLLTAVSQARPKIAPYPFTTLHPQIGVVQYEDFLRLVVCDVPGLIEGAHQNVGLGHAFLRHIQRCTALALVIDMAGTDGRHPWEDFRQLENELACYDPQLIAKPRLVVANKMDEPAAAENLRRFQKTFPDQPVLEMAAAFDLGIPAFRSALRQIIERHGAAIPPD